MLEGIACFVIGAVVVSIAGTAILGISCFFANRLFEVESLIEDPLEPSVEDAANNKVESTAPTEMNSSNPYAVPSAAPVRSTRRSGYPPIPAKYLLLVVVLVSWGAYIGLFYLGSVAVVQYLEHNFRWRFLLRRYHHIRLWWSYRSIQLR